MVVERFYEGCTNEIYQRLRTKGRMLPEGLVSIDSWLAKEGDKCFQLMKTKDVSLFDIWMENWKDLGSFEIVELGPKPQG